MTRFARANAPRPDRCDCYDPRKPLRRKVLLTEKIILNLAGFPFRRVQDVRAQMGHRAVAEEREGKHACPIDSNSPSTYAESSEAQRCMVAKWTNDCLLSWRNTAQT